MTRAILAIFSLIVLASLGAAHAAEIVAMRASSHKDFHRLTIIFSETTPLSVSNRQGTLLISLSDLAAKPIAELPVTDYIAVKGLAPAAVGSKGQVLEVETLGGSSVKYVTRPGPFRILIDVFPPPGYLARKSQPRPRDEAMLFRPEVSRLVAFNDSWRWVYRRDLVDELKPELYREPLAGPFMSALGIAAPSGEKELMESIDEAVDALRGAGEQQKADALRLIADFHFSGAGRPELESAIRGSQDVSLARLGYFILGDHFERKGFYPEAAAYFARASEGQGPIRAEALFRRGRIFFLENKYADAKELFKSSIDEGYDGALVWLANTALIKGETDLARSMYKRGVRAVEGLDPISRLSLADMHLASGDYQDARYAYAGLRARYPRHEMFDTFLVLKEGDAYLAEGKTDAAVLLYLKTKEKLRGEQWAMAALALADAYLARDDAASLAKAEQLFESVVKGRYAGAETAALRLVTTKVMLGKHAEAYSEIKRFVARHPLSTLRQDMDRVSSVLFYEWIEALQRKEDHLGAVRLYLETPLSVPFGKKAETYLRMGKSFLAVGLLSDGVGMLDSAVKIGDDRIAEEATVLLARAYLEQRDTGSAERLLDAYRLRFPRGAGSARIRDLEAQIAFLKQDYASVLRHSGPGGLASEAMRAEALFQTGKMAEAAALFERAARGFSAGGEAVAASKAYMRGADALFESRGFSRAAEGYRLALGLLGPEQRQDRQWALYRLARCYSILGLPNEAAKALAELKTTDGELGPWSEEIFREARGL